MLRVPHLLPVVLTTLIAAAGCRDGTGLPLTRCSAPAPLYGAPDVRAPGFIVVYRDGVDATAETNRLAAQYTFTPRTILDGGLRGFAAELSAPTLARLRCEPTIRYVSHETLLMLGQQTSHAR